MSAYDVLFVGAGPAGYVGAVRAAQLGLRTVVVEADRVGGACLQVGCIPTKALLASAHHYRAVRAAAEFGIEVGEVGFAWERIRERAQRVVATNERGIERGLFRKYGVELIRGRARLAGPRRVTVVEEEGTRTLTAEHVILATGSRPHWLPGWTPVPGRVIDSDAAVFLPELPRRAIVVGAGAIGCEFAWLWASFGVEVTLLELTEEPLPGLDGDLRRAARRILEASGVVVRTGVRVEPPVVDDTMVAVTVGEERLTADVVLLAVGRRPNSEELGLEAVGLEPAEGGWVTSDPRSFRTREPWLYAVGDLRGGPLLAHKASAEAIACVEGIAGRATVAPDPAWIPGVVYLHPELASVGLSEEAAAARGEVRVGRFPLTASGRARAEGEREGFVKVVLDAETEALLGLHVVAEGAGEAIGFGALARVLEATGDELGAVVLPHPTRFEGVLDALGLAREGHGHNV